MVVKTIGKDKPWYPWEVRRAGIKGWEIDVSNEVIRGGLTEKSVVEQRLEGGEGVT